MDKACLESQVGAALSALCRDAGVLEKREDCPSSEFMVRMPCYAAFFSIVDSSLHLAQQYASAEKEVEALLSAKSVDWPRDLQLVFIIAGERPPEPALVRRMMDDRYVCRKFVLWPNGRAVTDVLADLPFWPPDSLLGGAPASLGTGVQEAVKGYDPGLINDLANHSPGVEVICRRITEGKYELESGPSADRTGRLSRLPPSTLAKLEALDITDFRGIRRLRPEEMPLTGRVVFIYGSNGVGKTSISDAVEWAITGRVARLSRCAPRSPHGSPDPIINVFSSEGKAQVICHFGQGRHICRAKQGQSTQRLIESRSAPDDRHIIDYVVGTRKPSDEARLRIERLRDLFRGSHLLSQHDMRQFLEETQPADRFDILTNMIGAEEFVRFRGKVAAVLRHLRTQLETLADQNRSLSHELEDVSKRLSDRQRDFDRLSHAVAPGRTPEDLASELLQGTRACQCAIDEVVIEKINAEPVERRFELISLHAETAIRSKRTYTEDLLVRLQSIEQGLQGYIESQTRCANLTDEITTAKSVSERMRADRQKQEKARENVQANLLALRTKQLENSRKVADLCWLRENLPSYLKNREALRRMEDSLKEQREDLRKLDGVLEEHQKLLGVKRARLQEVELAISTKVKRSQVLTNLLKRLPEIQAKQHEAEQWGARDTQLKARTGELRQKADSTRSESNEARARVDKLQRAYDSEAARHDVLNSVLAKLAELVHAAECPLCGQQFASREDAKNAIQKHLTAVPLPLRDLAHQLDEAKKGVDAKRAQAETIAAGIRDLEAESERVHSDREDATRVVQGFVADCATLGVALVPDNTASWQSALELASKQYDVASLHSEASGLRDDLNVLSSRVIEQQHVADGLRRRLVRDEKENSGLVSAVQELETGMLQRGHELGSLPQAIPLAEDMSQAQDELKKCAEAVATREMELRTIEAEIKKSGDNLRQAEESIASKETQLRQYETSRSRFIAACHATGVEADNPRESIRSARQKALELNQSLLDLEEKRRVLQQIAGLARLRSEVDDLARVRNDVRRRAEECSRGKSHLHDWISRLENLEREVVRWQVDLVSTHLKRLEPTIQGLCQRLNPHPIFGNVKLTVCEKTRELDIDAEPSVAREQLGDIAVAPSEFFSGAQINSLAITVFLAGALRQTWSGFSTVLIDDPVQQMDEMNVYAFLDLIRGLSSQRQFIIFTCSREFYLLAIEKLVCLNKSVPGSFLAYRLEGTAPAEFKVYCDTHSKQVK